MFTQATPLLVATLLLMAVGSPAAGQSQTDMTGQACDRLKKADQELNRVYRQILSARSSDARFGKALRDAQRAWVSFRDAHLTSLYPDPDPHAYGSVNPMCRCGVLEQLTTDRTKQLRRLWVEGTAEGDVCAGSSLTK